MTHLDIQNHRAMIHHSPRDLLIDLQDHMSWARMHLDEYRARYPDTPVDVVLLEIRRGLTEFLTWMAFGDLQHDKI